MRTISTIRRCRRLPANFKGRDFVVGDLHGHRSLLEQELDKLGFERDRDRLFSVGDLIDRGPESLATLSLIDEPWFHAVLGNHELALLNYLRYYRSRIHSRKAFPAGGGAWINEALRKHASSLRNLADRLAELPIALHVEGEAAFNVMHGDLHPIGSRQENLFREATVSVHEADLLTTSRSNIRQALKSEQVGLFFAPHPVRLSASPCGTMPLTYVGHSPVPQVVVHSSYVYIDQRVGAKDGSQTSPRPPTILDHTRFFYWLRGAATVLSPSRSSWAPEISRDAILAGRELGGLRLPRHSRPWAAIPLRAA